MMSTIYYVGDFETTVYQYQTETEVWASALCKIPEDEKELEKTTEESCLIFTSIDETFDYLKNLSDNVIVYYHNLKFDGMFWLDFLLRKGFTNAISEETEEWHKDSKMPVNSMKYTISTLGQWYSIKLKVRVRKKGKDCEKYIEFRDSLKLLPFSVKEIGKAFHTRYQKLEMEYVGERHANGIITIEELNYICNDVLVMAEAMYHMRSEGYNKTTIGSCCVSEYKKTIDRKDYEMFFPDLTKIILPTGENVDSYVRDSYKGGWCYVKKSEVGKIQANGFTLDVNSLYSSMMHSKSNNYYPVGEPLYLDSEHLTEKLKYDDLKKYYYFIRFKCKFKIKEDCLPFVQIKNNTMYNGREHLTTSDIRGKNGEYYTYYKNLDGINVEARPLLTMTCTDWLLFNSHYMITDLEVVDYLIFRSCPCNILFDAYINHFMEIKKREKGAKRTQAKLFLNNLYGKTATSNDSSYKIAEIQNDIIKFKNVHSYKKPVWYIPIGSAITSYARNFTIRTAQSNYENFCYADTDSIHCKGNVKDVRGVVIDDKELCCWKLEQEWSEAVFVRPKTYIEKVEQHYDIKCAGMPTEGKNCIAYVLGEDVKLEENELTQDFVDYYKNNFTLKDFTTGLTVPNKLIPKTIKGGVILKETLFTIK